MNTRYKPFELIDYLKSHNVDARLGVGRISIPASFSIHDDSSVIANYIVGYHAALRKRAIA